MFGSPIPGEYVGLGAFTSQRSRDFTYGLKACTFISVYALLKILTLDPRSKTALLDLLPSDDWLNLSDSLPIGSATASHPSSPSQRPRAQTTIPAGSTTSTSHVPARMRSYSIAMHPTYQQTLQAFFDEAIKAGINAHKNYCTVRPGSKPSDYKPVSDAVEHSDSSQHLSSLASGGALKIELTANFFDLDKSASIISSQNGGILHYDISSQQLFSLQRPLIPNVNPQTIDSYTFVLGAQDHAIAVVRFHNHWFLFNSLAESLLSTEAYIRYFTSTGELVAYLKYLYSALPPQGNGMQGGGIQYNLFVKSLRV